MYVDCSLTVDLLYGEALSDWVAWAEAFGTLTPKFWATTCSMQYRVALLWLAVPLCHFGRRQSAIMTGLEH
jgi:hypothetical protein